MVLAGGKKMVFPYTISGQVALFPWKFHWKHSRHFRYLTYSLILSFPMFCWIHKKVHSPGNVRQWEQIRKKRMHTHFDPVE